MATYNPLLVAVVRGSVRTNYDHNTGVKTTVIVPPYHKHLPMDSMTMWTYFASCGETYETLIKKSSDENVVNSVEYQRLYTQYLEKVEGKFSGPKKGNNRPPNWRPTPVPRLSKMDLEHLGISHTPVPLPRPARTFKNCPTHMPLPRFANTSKNYPSLPYLFPVPS